MTRRRRPRSGGYYGGAGATGNAGGTADALTASAPSAQTDAGRQPAPQGQRRWYKMDLHTHTPASSDYEDARISYLDWLRMAADRGLDIVAITDHNTVAGVAAIRREIEWLTRLEQQNRLNDVERAALAAWRELSNRVLVLPGFEFTATFGFHILGIFAPETSVRTLEHILLSLKVPPEKIDIGSTETGSATDVLNAYHVIREAGGLAIAAHANSTHGVAMRNFPFGGQTKIAYTQDVNLDALEVTDLEHRGYSTARFFNGSKSEYPRRMHSIQGSDAHRLTMDPRNPKRLGIGERATEVFLEDSTFEALATLLRSTAWELTRPARPKEKPFDALAAARAAGPSLVQSFHESATKAGGKMDAILADICAFANTAGGAAYVGVSLRRDGPLGLTRPNQVEQQILDAVGERITPSLVVRPEIVKSDAASVLRLQVPKGDDRPHALDGTQIWVRDDKSTRAAHRDEIVAMVLEVMEQQSGPLEPDVEMVALQRDAGAPAAYTATAGVTGDGAMGESASDGDATAAESAARPKARRSRRGGGRSSGRKPAPVEESVADFTPEAAPASEGSGIPVENRQAAMQPIAVEPEVFTPGAAEPSGKAQPTAAEEVVEAKPRPKRSRTRKTTAADAPPANVAGAATAAAAEPKTMAAGETTPKPRATRRKTTSTTKSASKPTSVSAAAENASAEDAASAEEVAPPKPATRKRTPKAKATTAESAPMPAPATVFPQIGVEIVESEARSGVWHHSIRDMRNGSVIKGVTRRGARDLWNYAIRAYEEKRFSLDDIEWRGDFGLLHVEKRAGKMRYDLALRTPEGVRIFYGVTDEGMPGPWAVFIEEEE